MLVVALSFMAAVFAAISLILDCLGKKTKVRLLISGELLMATSVMSGYVAGYDGNWFLGITAVLVFIFGTVKMIAATFPGKIKVAITSTG